MRTLKRITSVVATLALAGTGVLLANPSAQPTTLRTAAAAPVHTPFTLSAFAWATRVIGGAVPAHSGRTAFAGIGCTSLAGLRRSNTQVGILPPEIAAVRLAHSVVRTYRGANNITHSLGVNKIAKVRLASTSVGSLTLNTIVARSHTWKSATGYHAANVINLGSIVFNPAVGPTQTFPAPAPGQTRLIPGLASITLGARRAHVTPNGAVADAGAVRIKLIPSGTVIFLGHSHAKMFKGGDFGAMRGSSYGTKLNALGGVAFAGPTPLLIHPCQSTYGHIRGRAIATISPPNLVARGLKTAMWSQNYNGYSKGWQLGKVVKVNLGNGKLVIQGASAVARVTRNAGGVTRSARGTTPGVVTVNGTRHFFPNSGVLTIPGVAKLESSLIRRTRIGLDVIAVKVTLLDGSGAVIYLGHARFGISRV